DRGVRTGRGLRGMQPHAGRRPGRRLRQVRDRAVSRMTEDEFDDLADRLIDKLGCDPRTFMRELVQRGRKQIRMTPAEMIAIGGADISEIATGGGNVTIHPGNPNTQEIKEALFAGMRLDWRAGMDRAHA